MPHGGDRRRSAYRGAALAAAVRVVDRVHDRAADRRSDTEVAGLACLTELDVLVLKISHLAYCSLAVETHESDLAGGKPDLCLAVLLGHKLRGCARGGGRAVRRGRDKALSHG